MAFQGKSRVVLVGNFVCHSPLKKREGNSCGKWAEVKLGAKTPGIVTWD